MTTAHNARVTGVTLISPDPPKLARFHAQLLGWPIGVEEPGWVTLPNTDGGMGLAFHIEDVYTPPTWPSEPGKQIMQMHLEVLVDDLEAGCVHAQACGATLAEYRPQDADSVHLDPDGHPFCISIAGQ